MARGRGLATAGLSVPLHVAHTLWMAVFLVLTAVTFSLVGFIIGIWADGFEKRPHRNRRPKKRRLARKESEGDLYEPAPQ